MELTEGTKVLFAPFFVFFFAHRHTLLELFLLVDLGGPPLLLTLLKHNH